MREGVVRTAMDRFAQLALGAAKELLARLTRALQPDLLPAQAGQAGHLLDPGRPASG